MDPLKLQHQKSVLMTKLLVWSGLSLATGLYLQNSRDPFRRGLGQQFVGWGVVDGLISLIGLGAAWRNASSLAAHHPVDAPSETAREARSLQRLLAINSGLDVIYIVGGLELSRRRGAKEPYWHGAGLGIIIQGGFLFFFDILNALRISASRRH